MLSFIHTADIHLDTPFASLAELHERRQADVRQTLTRIRDLVWDKQVDFWLIAGDLLEFHGGRRSTAVFLQQLFASIAPIPVLIAAGNHDPWVERSYYRTMDWPANVFFFTDEWGVLEFPEKSCAIYGWSFPNAHYGDSPLAQFPGKLPAYRYHLMVLHGTLLTSEAEGHQPYAPFSLQELADIGVHYAALGHIHKPAQFLNPYTKRVFAAYPGSPEGLTSKESGERTVIYGTLSDEQQLHLQTIPVHTREIVKLDLPLAGAETNEQLIAKAEVLLAKVERTSLVYVRLTGERAAHFEPSLSLLKEHFRDFFSIQFTDKSRPDVDEDKLRAEQGILAKWLELLDERAAAAMDERQRKVAELARAEALRKIGGSLR